MNEVRKYILKVDLFSFVCGFAKGVPGQRLLLFRKSLETPDLGEQTLMDLTRLAVVLATSLADCTNCLLATGLGVLDEARRQALHRAEVCLATMVAADRT